MVKWISLVLGHNKSTYWPWRNRFFVLCRCHCGFSSSEREPVLRLSKQKRTGPRVGTVSELAPEPPRLNRVQHACSVLCTVCLMLKGLNLPKLKSASSACLLMVSSTTCWHHCQRCFGFCLKKKRWKNGFSIFNVHCIPVFPVIPLISRYFLNFSHFLSTVSSPKGTPLTAEIEQGGFVL